MQKHAWAWWILEFMFSGLRQTIAHSFVLFFFTPCWPCLSHVEQGHFYHVIIANPACDGSVSRLGGLEVPGERFPHRACTVLLNSDN